MATTVSNFDLKLAADQSVGALVPYTEELTSFALAVKNESAISGDSISVPYYANTGTVSAFNTSSNNYATEGTNSLNHASVVLAHYKDTFGFLGEAITRVDMAKVFEMLGANVLRKCAILTHDQITAAAAGAAVFTGAASTFDMDDVLDLEVEANNAGFPLGARALLIADTYLANVKKSNALVSLENAGADTTQAMTRYEQLGGFKIIGSNSVKSNTLAENLTGYIAHTQAIAIAAAYPHDASQEDGGIRVERRLVGGLPMQFRLHYDRNAGKYYATAELVFGAKLVQTAGVKRIVSA